MGRALDLRERSGHGGGFLAAAERRWRIARKNVETNSVKKIDRAAWSEPHGPVSDGPLSVVVSRLLMDGLAEAKASRHHSGLKLCAFQAEEVRTLATKVAADMAEPTKAHMTRSMDDVSKAS